MTLNFNKIDYNLQTRDVIVHYILKSLTVFRKFLIFERQCKQGVEQSDQEKINLLHQLLGEVVRVNVKFASY